jgi:hypothetical protein
VTRGARRIVVLIAVLLYVGATVAYGVWAQSKVNAWSVERSVRIAASRVVYVTPTGEKYHRRSHYAQQNHAISLYEAKEQGLEPCRICFREQISSGIVIPNSIERRADRIELLASLPWYQYHWIAMVLLFTLGLIILTGLALLTPLLVPRLLQRFSKPRADTFH